MCYIYLTQKDIFMTKVHLMKKAILLFCSLILFWGAEAQVSFAPLVGFNISQYGFSDNVPGVKVRSGMKAGVIAEAPLSGRFYLQSGAFYVMNGFRIVPMDLLIDMTYNINTIEIPLNATFKTGAAGKMRFFASIGPYVGFNLWGNMTSK